MIYNDEPINGPKAVLVTRAAIEIKRKKKKKSRVCHIVTIFTTFTILISDNIIIHV